MNLYCATSWYDEPVDQLRRAITDAIECGCTHVVALDGAYRHYPHLDPVSPPEQAQTIKDVCAERDIQCVVDSITDATEAQKRTRLFEMVYEAGATEQDYIFIQDADHRLHNKQDLKPILHGDVWSALVIEGDTTRYKGHKRRRWARLCYRAQPGLHVHPEAHWVYLNARDEVLWGYNSITATGDLPVWVENESLDRDKHRRKNRDAYYKARHTEAVERFILPASCHYCDQMWTRDINADFHAGVDPDGAFDVCHRHTLFVCDEHVAYQQQQNHDRITEEAARFIKRQKRRVWNGDVTEAQAMQEVGALNMRLKQRLEYKQAA